MLTRTIDDQTWTQVLQAFISGSRCYRAIFYHIDDPSFTDTVNMGGPTLRRIDTLGFLVFRGTHNQSFQRQPIPITGVTFGRHSQ
jgi:hypothetical protein